MRRNESTIPSEPSKGRGPTQRQRRVAEVVRHALAEVLSRKNLRDPILNEIRLTITEVNVGGDLRIAMVYLLFSDLSYSKEEILKRLNQSRAEIRAQLPSLLSLKFVPDIHFRYDTSLDYSEKINTLLQSANVRKDIEI